MSRGLEVFERLENNLAILNVWSVNYGELEIIGQELKSWDIVKEKRVKMGDLLYCCDLETYNKNRDACYKLTKQEYDLVKEVLL